MAKRNSIFSTPNTALAAYLLSEGYELLDTNTDNPQELIFTFQDSIHLKELVRNYNIGTAQGNINAFYYNYRKLVSLAQKHRRLYGKTQP